MMGITEKKMYRVLKNVGVKRIIITSANKVDDLYLDEFDQLLLGYYFENEFKVRLEAHEITELTNLNLLYDYLNRKNLLNYSSD